MSILSSFFIGTKAQALANDGLEGGPADRCIPLEGIGMLEVSSLGELLVGEDCSFSLVCSDDEDSVFTMCVPETFVQALQGMDEAKASSLVDAWMSEGDPVEDFTPQEHKDLVLRLAELAKGVPELGEQMYYFTTA